MIDLPPPHDPFNALQHHREHMHQFIIINTDSKEIRQILQIDEPHCHCGPKASAFLAFNSIGCLMPSGMPLLVGWHTPCLKHLVI